MSKLLLNAPDKVVVESLDGLIASTAHLARLDGFPSIKVLYDRRHNGDERVAVISGGGSGHEPAFGGYVGENFLAAAVAGDIFAAPPEDSIVAAIRQVTGKAGALIVINNYTGDRLTFGSAAERAKTEGYNVELVIVADDCALPGKAAVGRRGLAGCVLALKIAGAAAATGASLEQVRLTTQHAIDSLGTMGCSLSTCTIPGQPPSARLGPNEMEIGMGLHGEPGAHRTTLQPVDVIINELVDRIAGNGAFAAGSSYLPLSPGDRVVAVVNNLGGATQLEMGVAVRATVQKITGCDGAGLGCVLERIWGGTLVSSLDMKGLSVSIMKLPATTNGNTTQAEEVLKLLDAVTDAPGWPRWGGKHDAEKKAATPLPTGPTDDVDRTHDTTIGTMTPSMNMMRLCIQAACEAMIAAEAELNQLDTTVGDGDCGSTTARGAAALIEQLNLNAMPLGNPAGLALALARVLGRSMGGTSGGIYKILWVATAGKLQESTSDKGSLTVIMAAEALLAGVEAVSKYGGAVEGNRTMLDALAPATRALQQSAVDGCAALDAASAAASAAEAGADATKHMEAGAGRSAYVPTQSLVGVPDPGALAVALWMRAVANALESSGN